MELYDFHSFFNLSFERHFEVVHCRGNAVSGYLLSFETKSLLRLEEEKINHVGIQSCLKTFHCRLSVYNFSYKGR